MENENGLGMKLYFKSKENEEWKELGTVTNFHLGRFVKKKVHKIIIRTIFYIQKFNKERNYGK